MLSKSLVGSCSNQCCPCLASHGVAGTVMVVLLKACLQQPAFKHLCTAASVAGVGQSESLIIVRRGASKTIIVRGISACLTPSVAVLRS